MAGRLEGKVAIITGGASGIGAATATLFAAEGAAVGICDLDRVGLGRVAGNIERSGGNVVAQEADVTASADVESFVRAVVDRFGRLDVVFANAGVGGRGSAPEMEEDEFYRIVRTNLGGAFLCAKHTIPHVARSGGGSLIFNASELALVGSRRNVAYTASKAGIIGMARSMALDHAPAGIRVNVIAPGAVDTPMLRHSIETAEDPAAYETLIQLEIALGRIGRPEEIARTALFLASDDSSFITGTTIVADGGVTAQ